MKKLLLLIALITISSIAAFAQAGYEDVIYLKDTNRSGRIIKGKIIDRTGGNIQIETIDGLIHFYQFNEIEKMTRKPITGPEPDDKGFAGSLGFGYCFAVPDGEGRGLIKFNLINGYRFNPYFSFGLGVGVRYSPWASDEALIPIFLATKINFLNKKVSPFLSIDIGYHLYVPHIEGSGFMLNPTIGICKKTGDKTSFNFGIGYDMFQFTDIGTGHTISLNLIFAY